MKQISHTLLLAFTACVFLFSSCKKNNTAIPVPQIATTSISLKFSGSLYTCVTVVAFYNKSLHAIQIGGVLGINGYINLIIPNVGVGTFDLSGGNASLSFANGSNMVDTYSSTSGSVAVTEFTNNTIVGTFEFTGVDPSGVSRTITEGQFTTSYTSQ